MNNYMRFVSVERAGVVQANPSFTFGEVAAELGKMWRNMSDEEKERYSGVGTDLAYASWVNANAGKAKGKDKVTAKATADDDSDEEEEEEVETFDLHGKCCERDDYDSDDYYTQSESESDSDGDCDCY